MRQKEGNETRGEERERKRGRLMGDLCSDELDLHALVVALVELGDDLVLADKTVEDGHAGRPLGLDGDDLVLNDGVVCAA